MKTPVSKQHRFRFGFIMGLTAVLALLVWLGGCAPQRVDPMQLPMLAEDEVQAPHPPSDEELTRKAQVLLPLVVYRDETVTEARLQEVLDFIHRTFEAHGNFAVIPRQDVQVLLADPANRQYQTANVSDAIQLGRSLEAAFVSQMQVTIAESKMEQGIDRFIANINLTVFTTESGQVVIRQDIRYNSRRIQDSQNQLKTLVQQYFPLRGYILETRGGRQVAKLSLGRSLGISLGREFQVRERTVSTEYIDGTARQTISYEPAVIAIIEIIQLGEEDSWAQVKEADRSRIRVGQTVFALPEKAGIFR
jgi:hypothetical protein